MATSSANHVDFVYDRLKFDKAQIEGGSYAKVEVESFSLKDFWTQFEAAVQGLSNEVTKIGFLCSQEPYPKISDLELMMANLLQYYNMTRDLFCVLPQESGQTLHKSVTSAVVSIIRSLQDFVLSLNDLSKNGVTLRLPLTGAVWEACSAVSKLPKDNAEASLRVIEAEKSLATDALEELNTVKDISTNSAKTENNYEEVNNVKELEELKIKIQKELEELEKNQEEISALIDLTASDNESHSNHQNKKEKMSKKSENGKLCVEPCDLKKIKSNITSVESSCENEVSSTSFESGFSGVNVKERKTMTTNLYNLVENTEASLDSTKKQEESPLENVIHRELEESESQTESNSVSEYSSSCGGNLPKSSPLDADNSSTHENEGMVVSVNIEQYDILLPKLKDWVVKELSFKRVPSLALLEENITAVEKLLTRLNCNENDLLYKDLSVYQKTVKQKELRLKLVDLQLFKQMLKTQPHNLDKIISEVSCTNRLAVEKVIEGNSVLTRPKEFFDNKTENVTLFSDSQPSSSEIPKRQVKETEINMCTNTPQDIKISELKSSQDITKQNISLDTSEENPMQSCKKLHDLVKWVHRRLKIKKSTTMEDIIREYKQYSNTQLLLNGPKSCRINYQPKRISKLQKKVIFLKSLLTFDSWLFTYVISKFKNNPMLLETSESIENNFSLEEFKIYCIENEGFKNNTHSVQFVFKGNSDSATETLMPVDDKAMTVVPAIICTNTTNIKVSYDDPTDNINYRNKVENHREINSRNEILHHCLDNWVQKQIKKENPCNIEQLNREIKYLNEFGQKKAKYAITKTIIRCRLLATMLGHLKQIVELNPSILELICNKYKAKPELIKCRPKVLDNKSLYLFNKWKRINQIEETKQSTNEVVCDSSSYRLQANKKIQELHSNANTCFQNSFKSNYCTSTSVGLPRIETKDNITLNPNVVHNEPAVLKINDGSSCIALGGSKPELINISTQVDSTRTNFRKDPFSTENEVSSSSESLHISKRLKVGDFRSDFDTTSNKVTTVDRYNPAFAMLAQRKNNTIEGESSVNEIIESKSNLSGVDINLNHEENSSCKTPLNSCKAIVKLSHVPGQNTFGLKSPDSNFDHKESKTSLVQQRPCSISSSLEVAKLSQAPDPNCTPFDTQFQQMHMFLPTPTVQCCSSDFIQYYPHLNIKDVLENIRKRNPGLQCERWIVYREWKDELNCYNYSLGVDELSVRSLLSQGNRARVTFKYYALFQKINA